MELRLIENRTHRASLSEGQVQVLLKHVPELSVVPVLGRSGEFDLTPSRFVGIVECGTLLVHIQPKVPMRSVLFMLAYAIDPKHWRELYALYDTDADLLDAISMAFSRELSRVLRRGVLRGYVDVRETLQGVRGRIVIGDQLRRWFGRVPPVECAYDDFTEDVLENRLLKAALGRLRGVRVRSSKVRGELAHVDLQLSAVEELKCDHGRVAAIVYTRLNERFRRALELARLIVSSTTLESGRRGVSASAFIVDMAAVFEEFVLAALSEASSLHPLAVSRKKERAFLDHSRRVTLIPDLAFREGGRVRVVGDVKYKRTAGIGLNHPDAYQVLAYIMAFDVTNGFLIYPKTEGHSSIVYDVRNIPKRLQVVELDLALGPTQLLRGVQAIARAVRASAVSPV